MPIPGFFPVNFDQIPDPIAESEVKITFLVKDMPAHKSLSNFSFGYLHGEPDGNSIFRDFRLPCPMRAWIELSGLNDHPTLSVNKTYYRMGRLRINDFCPPGIHVRDVLLVGLIGAGYVPIHGSSFAAGDKGIIVVGPPGIGKTLILLRAIQQGCQYLTDEMTIVDGKGNIYPCSGISSISYESGLARMSNRSTDIKLWKARLIERMSHVIPLLGYAFPSSAYLDIRSFAPQLEIAGKTKAHKIFILAQGNSRLEKLSTGQALNMILQMNRLEFGYYGNHMLLAYSLLNPWFNIKGLMRSEEELLQKLVTIADCYLCVASSPDEHYSLIQRNI
jgi:hypothetical protein